jgi:pentatricopeptide repeat protein
MGGQAQTLVKGVRSRFVTCPPPRASSSARDHHLFAVAARVLRLEASSSSSTTYLWNRLLGLFSRNGPPALARRLFDAMPERDTVSYNTHIGRLSRSGSAAEGARAYSRMLREDGVRPDGTTLSALLALPSAGASHGLVRQVHSHAVRLGLCSNAFVGTALVRAYEQRGDTGATTAVFQEVVEPDAVCWNVMTDACTRRGSLPRAVEMLSRMRRAGGVADGFTLASFLKACCSREDNISLGLQLHTWACKIGVDSETAICNALITMYMKCGAETSSAVQVFQRTSEPNIITWTSLISGFVQNGLAVEAVSFYKVMVKAGERENDYCFTSMLSAFGALASLEHGKMAHSRVMKSVFCSDTIVGNALLDMYFKCGSSSDAGLVFHTMQVHDVVSWTTMIVGFGRHGEARKAVLCFREMVHDGFRPDCVTFLAVLSACRQGDLVDEGLAVFRSMVEDHDVIPRREHCACLVDLLGHAGRLKEAETLITAMGLEMDSLAWESLLGACGLHGEVELGKRSAGKVMELEPWNYGPYVLLSNMYAEQCQWREKEVLRERLDGSNVRKGAGHSWFSVSEAS